MGPDRETLRFRIEALRERVLKACARSGRDPDSVRLVAVTKTHPAEAVQALIDSGIRDIGENRVQEIEEKVPLLTGEFTLHMVGHLQSNKAGRVLPHVQWIHSVDREKLIARIESCSRETHRIAALVEVNTTGETSKSGCTPGECSALCEMVRRSRTLELRGLMTIGPLEGGEKEARRSFSLLRRLGEECRGTAPAWDLSMGMSGDFEWAIEEGSTIIRVGTALLGHR